MTTRVSEKGQVTIPKKVRDRLGIRPGDELEFRDEGGVLVAEKVLSRDVVAEVYGRHPTGRDTDAIIEELRGRPDAV